MRLVDYTLKFHSMMKQQVKQVPYGVSDFATVMRQNLYSVDKTMFLPELEKQPRNLFFVRPRRFGKSLFLSMLYSYYDCNQKESFEKLFGSLWIWQHPTSLQGIYQVLFLDFSQITGKIEILEERFNAYLCIKLDSFAEQYPHIMVIRRFRKSRRRHSMLIKCR